MCLTCDLINQRITPPGGIIYKNDEVILHQCLDIDIAGYLILSPIRHVASYQSLTDPELTALHAVLKRASMILEKLPSLEKIYICSLGEQTSHFHFHLFPRFRWMLDYPACKICTDNKLDGAKLLSFMRAKYNLPCSTTASSDVVKTAEHIRKMWHAGPIE